MTQRGKIINKIMKMISLVIIMLEEMCRMVDDKISNDTKKETEKLSYIEHVPNQNSGKLILLIVNIIIFLYKKKNLYSMFNQIIN